MPPRRRAAPRKAAAPRKTSSPRRSPTSRRAAARPGAAARIAGQTPAAEGERLQKVLAAAGVASRRSSEELISAGRVRVDGAVVTTLGTRVDAARARIEVDGKRVAVDPRRKYLALNKPPGYITTAKDEHGRPTVLDLVGAKERLFPVGRLDADTTGLLILTNDGPLANRLAHPRYGVERTYVAEVDGRVSTDVVKGLVAGVYLEDGPARARRARVRAGSKQRTQIEITMTEGRKREVRRMLEAAGHPVRRLVRVSFGPIKLGNLALGKTRSLSPQEVGDLQRLVGR